METSYVFCKATRRARVAAELTQEQLADKLKVNRPTVCRLESGRTGMSETMFLRVANALGITALELLGYGYE